MPGSRDGAIKIGVRASAAAGGTARQRTGAIRIGLLVAGTSPPWAGRARGARAKADWLPRFDMAWVDPKTGRPTHQFYQFIREIAETRLGGVNGSTVAEVATTVTQTQAEVVATSTYAQNVATYAQGVAATATATAQVAQSNSLSGATSIPATPEPPQRITDGTS